MIQEKKWMRGHCWDMAIALHEKTKLPIYGLFDKRGDCHHAFVWDESISVGIDARGALMMSGLRAGCAGQESKPLARDDIEKIGGFLGRALAPQEINVAWTYAKKMKLVDQWHVRGEEFAVERAYRASQRSKPRLGH
jgi:hypothetical protein